MVHKLGPGHEAIDQRAFVGSRHVEALVIAPTLVFLQVAACGAVHPRKPHGEFRVVIRLAPFLLSTVDVFLRDEVLLIWVRFHEFLCCVFPLETLDPTLRRAPLFHHAVALHPRRLAVQVGLVQTCGAAPKLSLGQGPVPILLAAEVAQQGKQVLGVVLVHGWVRCRPDHDRGEGAVTQKQHGHAQGEGVDGPPSFLAGHHDKGHNQRHQKGQVHQGSGVEWQAQIIHKKQFETARKLHRTFDQHLLDKAQQHQGHPTSQHQSFPSEAMLPVVVHHGDGRDGQQVEQVHPNGEPHEVGNQDDPLGGILPVRLIFPFQNCPKHQGREEAGQGIHLPFHCAEPERVAERIRQGTHRTRTQHCQHISLAQFLFACQSFGQMGDAPKQEQDREGTAQHREAVGRQGRRFRAHGHHQEARQQHEKRCSRGVAHFKLVRRSDEFPAVPKTGGGFHCEDKDKRGKGPYGPSSQVVESFKTHAGSNLREGTNPLVRVHAKVGQTP